MATGIDVPRVLMVPSAGSWSFSLSAADLPVTITLPAGAKHGEVTFTATSTTGSTPIDPQGGIGTVVIDGGAPNNTACLQNGSESIAIPANSTTLAISTALGCHAGPDPTDIVVSGVTLP